jgi:hypothetical protein
LNVATPGRGFPAAITVIATAPGASIEIGTVLPFSAISGAVREIPVDAASAPPVTPITNSFTGIAADESEGKMVASAAAPPIAIVSRRVNFIFISLDLLTTYSFNVER